MWRKWNEKLMDFYSLSVFLPQYAKHSTKCSHVMNEENRKKMFHFIFIFKWVKYVCIVGIVACKILSTKSEFCGQHWVNVDDVAHRLSTFEQWKTFDIYNTKRDLKRSFFFHLLFTTIYLKYSHKRTFFFSFTSFFLHIKFRYLM